MSDIQNQITLPQLQKDLLEAYQRTKSWREVGEEFYINPGTAHRIAHGYDPKSSDIRNILDLPVLAPAPVCPDCGIVHQGRCPKRRKPRVEWRDGDGWLARLWAWWEALEWEVT